MGLSCQVGMAAAACQLDWSSFQQLRVDNMGSLDQIFPPAVYLAESPSCTLGWPQAHYAAEDDFELLFFTFMFFFFGNFIHV